MIKSVQFKIKLTKLTEDRHRLMIVRPNGDSECIECETRSFLVHDFLHFAIETEARLQTGVWGILARGKTLTDINDRTGESLAAETPELMTVERVVGALTNLTKGMAPATLMAGLRAQGAGLGWDLPVWLDEDFMAAVQERMRRLLGQWKAVPFGSTMDLEWEFEGSE